MEVTRSDTMRYKMKIDLWIGILLFGSVFMFVPLVFIVPADERWVVALTGTIMAIFILPFYYGYHELNEDAVFTRLGFFKQTVKYEKIKSIRMCTNWLSSMAMTGKRIEIKEHNKGTIRGTTYIGPVNREEFYEELKRRCYNLEEKKELDNY